MCWKAKHLSIDIRFPDFGTIEKNVRKPDYVVK